MPDFTLNDAMRRGDKPDPHKWHTFRPRRYGSKDACGVDGCGARPEDPIHYQTREAKPPR